MSQVSVVRPDGGEMALSGPIRISGSPATTDQITDLMARYATEPASTYATEPERQ
jgi:hypothetical protein